MKQSLLLIPIVILFAIFSLKAWTDGKIQTSIQPHQNQNKSLSFSYPDNYQIVSTTIDDDAKKALETEPPVLIQFVELDLKELTQQEAKNRDYGEPTLDSSIYIAEFSNPENLDEKTWLHRYSYYPRAVIHSIDPPEPFQDADINGANWKMTTYNGYFTTNVYYKSFNGKMFVVAAGKNNTLSNEILSTINIEE